MSFMGDLKEAFDEIRNNALLALDGVADDFVNLHVVPRTPLGITGDLQRSIEYTKAALDKGVIDIQVGSALEYAIEQHESVLGHPISEADGIFAGRMMFPDYAPNNREYVNSQDRYWEGWQTAKDQGEYYKWESKFLEKALEVGRDDFMQNYYDELRRLNG